MHIATTVILIPYSSYLRSKTHCTATCDLLLPTCRPRMTTSTCAVALTLTIFGQDEFNLRNGRLWSSFPCCDHLVVSWIVVEWNMSSLEYFIRSRTSSMTHAIQKIPKYFPHLYDEAVGVTVDWDGVTLRYKCYITGCSQDCYVNRIYLSEPFSLSSSQTTGGRVVYRWAHSPFLCASSVDLFLF